jgi:hypothetical protein
MSSERTVIEVKVAKVVCISRKILFPQNACPSLKKLMDYASKTTNGQINVGPEFIIITCSSGSTAAATMKLGKVTDQADTFN